LVGAAIVATMAATYLCLAYARPLLGRIGPKGIDAATRLVGFFVATMGMGLIFHGLIEALQSYGLLVRADGMIGGGYDLLVSAARRVPRR
jgi:multiple antibiotic resistance protein